MNKEDIVRQTEKWLNKGPIIKENIKHIDAKLRKNDSDKITMCRLQLERTQQNFKLTKIIDAISTLQEENQRIICYRYFEKLNYSQIALRVGLSNKTIPRRIDRCLLSIGRVIFGFEDEFWNKVFCDQT